MKKKTIILIILIVSLLALFTAIKYQQPSFIFELFSKTKSTNNGKTITHNGETGKTALKVLQKNAKILTSGTGKNAFITSINGVKANPKNQYWQLIVNGKSASVGAGSLITKDSDTITWELTSF